MKKWCLRILLLAGLFWWMSIIFGFSAETGEESQSCSDGITIRVVHFIAEDYEQLSKPEQEALFQKTSFFVRKTGHFGEYAILGVLISGLLLTFPQFQTKNILFFAAAVSIGLIYAASDEIHQGFVSGRSPGFFDVCVDTAGVFAGAVFIWILTKLLWVKKEK